MRTPLCWRLAYRVLCAGERLVELARFDVSFGNHVEPVFGFLGGYLLLTGTAQRSTPEIGGYRHEPARVLASIGTAGAAEG
jgi:hypothetical protein